MKLCKECKHAQSAGYQRPTNFIVAGRALPWICAHPEALELVEGQAKEPCKTQRLPGAACGPDGARWEEGVPSPTPELPCLVSAVEAGWKAAHQAPHGPRDAYVLVPPPEPARPWCQPLDKVLYRLSKRADPVRPLIARMYRGMRRNGAATIARSLFRDIKAGKHLEGG